MRESIRRVGRCPPPAKEIARVLHPSWTLRASRESSTRQPRPASRRRAIPRRRSEIPLDVAAIARGEPAAVEALYRRALRAGLRLRLLAGGRRAAGRRRRDPGDLRHGAGQHAAASRADRRSTPGCAASPRTWPSPACGAAPAGARPMATSLWPPATRTRRPPARTSSLERAETDRLVGLALTELPPHYQRALLDKYVQHRSFAEMAAVAAVLSPRPSNRPYSGRNVRWPPPSSGSACAGRTEKTMSDDEPPEDPPAALAGDPLRDETLERLLDRVARRQRPDPAFAERLRERLRRAGAAEPPPGRTRPRPALPGPSRPGSAGGCCPPRSPSPPAPPCCSPWLPASPRSRRCPRPVRTLAADAAGPAARARRRPGVAVRLSAPSSGPSRGWSCATGAEVTYRPATRPELELAPRVRARWSTPPRWRLRAADEELLVQAGSDVAFELVRNIEGGKDMRSLWLIPTSAVSGAALTLADPRLPGAGRAQPGRAAAAPTGEVVVLHPRPQPLSPASGTWRTSRRRSRALQQENGRLAGQLARRKGVTRASVLERIATLKSAPLAGMLSPGRARRARHRPQGPGRGGHQDDDRSPRSPATRRSASWRRTFSSSSTPRPPSPPSARRP